MVITRQNILELCNGNEEWLKSYEQEFFKDKGIMDIQSKITNLQRSGRIVNAMQLQQRLLKIEYDNVKLFIAENAKRAERVKLAHMGFKPEEREKIALLCVSIAMCADFVESYSMDVDSIIKRYEPDTAFLTFQPFRDVLGKARETLKWLSTNTDLYQYESWGNECDDLIQMIQNKAKKLIKKSNERKRKEFEAKQKEVEKNDT